MLRDLMVVILFVSIVAGVILNYIHDAKFGTNLIVVGILGISLLGIANKA